ncbi:hypothetical protein L2E82_23133 [Cichorium intybus]|uniref:Uncharacterized protein n=1 Tax=Cichorium intybus TaxID=13427 RepID=A0ACB9DZZ2_CICIN|nr:hypothetical protein L2E82_23133 [Cichorium intybus]
MVVVDLVQWWSREEREELKSRRSYIQPGRSQKSQICDFHSKATYGGDGRRGIQKFSGFGSTSGSRDYLYRSDFHFLVINYCILTENVDQHQNLKVFLDSILYKQFGS